MSESSDAAIDSLKPQPVMKKKKKNPHNSNFHFNEPGNLIGISDSEPALYNFD